MPPVLTLLTDFGTSDHYVAAMKAVILAICPKVTMVDITHDVIPYGIADAAYTLSQIWSRFPRGTVHLVVVDPGVGSSRRPILAVADGHTFVAPDNGVLGMVFPKTKQLEVREITAARYFLASVSRTFHGRDIFAPVASHLCAGVPPMRFGRKIEDFLRPGFASPIRTARRAWAGEVLKVDRFGNVITNYESSAFPLEDDAFSLQVGLRTVGRMFLTYAEAEGEEPFVIPGSSGFLEVSLQEASAARSLGVQAGAPLELRY